jgi:hypothetical protein
MKSQMRMGRMNSITKFAVVSLLLTGSIAFAGSGAKAKKDSSAEPGKHPVSAPASVINRKLLSSSWHFDDPLSSFAGGETLVSIDSPLSFNCPQGTCTVTADLQVQVGFNSSPQNRWAICPELDGSVMPPNVCPFMGEMLTDFGFTAGSFTFIQSSVTAGRHTLQSFISSDFGGFIGTYSITYRLYTP